MESVLCSSGNRWLSMADVGRQRWTELQRRRDVLHSTRRLLSICVWSLRWLQHEWRPQEPEDKHHRRNTLRHGCLVACLLNQSSITRLYLTFINYSIRPSFLPLAPLCNSILSSFCPSFYLCSALILPQHLFSYCAIVLYCIYTFI